MERRVTRRALLAGAATAGVAGCTVGDGADESGDGSGDVGALPSACPTTQGLDVEWPDELTAETATEFVEAYEERYYREVAVGYEPGSRLDDYRLSGSVQAGVEERGSGYVAEFAGGGALYKPGLHVTAQVADPPDGTDPAEYAEMDDEDLRRLLQDAVAADDDESAALGIETGAEIDAYLDLLESLFEGFEAFDGPNESATLYAEVEGTTVELSVYSDGFHGDYWWNAWYYVDEHVVRRTSEEDAEPTEGELLECRSGQ